MSTQYIIVRDEGIFEDGLSTKVNDFLSKSYELYGNPYCFTDQVERPWNCQAMIKNDKKQIFPIEKSYFLTNEQLEALELYSKEVKMSVDHICAEKIRELANNIKLFILKDVGSNSNDDQ